MSSRTVGDLYQTMGDVQFTLQCGSLQSQLYRHLEMKPRMETADRKDPATQFSTFQIVPVAGTRRVMMGGNKGCAL